MMRALVKAGELLKLGSAKGPARRGSWHRRQLTADAFASLRFTSHVLACRELDCFSVAARRKNAFAELQCTLICLFAASLMPAFAYTILWASEAGTQLLSPVLTDRLNAVAVPQQKLLMVLMQVFQGASQ